MSLESAIVEELQTISGLSNKIFPVTAPENTVAPYLVYFSNPGENDRSLMGFLSSKEVDIELHVLATDYSTLKTITSGVVQSLQSFAGRKIGIRDQWYVGEVDPEHPTEVWDSMLNLYRGLISCKINV